MKAFQLSQVVQRFDDQTILEIDSLELDMGGIYGLLGPNGAGKTTLLNILGILTPPASGNVKVFGETVVYKEAILQSYRKQIVLVSQNPILFTTTVFKNMEFGLKLRQFSQNQRNKIIEESLDLVGMRHMMHARAHKLSGGETQRVAIARALALSPKVLLCDEPTASVDLEHQSVVIDLLRQVNLEKKMTVVFTTHDRIQATNLAHQIIFLDHGKISPAPYENLFTVTVADHSDDQSQCNIYKRVDLLMHQTPSGDAKIIIDPAKIGINQTTIPTPGNVLVGKVIQINEEFEMVRLFVDSTIRLNVLIPKEHYQREGILVGAQVKLFISPEAIQVLR
jgi:tungstate transport system ATP-binding protein